MKAAVAALEERLEALNHTTSRVITDDQDSHAQIRQDLEGKLVQLQASLEDKLSGLSDNVLELLHFRDNLNL